MSSSILNLDDGTKADMRNYAMVAGFVAMFTWATSCLLFCMGDSTAVDVTGVNIAMVALAAVLFVAGLTLVLLGKRDLTALLFIIVSLWCIMAMTSANDLISTPMSTSLFLLGIIMLFTRDEQRWVVAGYMLIAGSQGILGIFGVTGVEFVVEPLIMIITAYAALAIACERYKLPFRDHLTADEAVSENDGEPVRFKDAGSILGYLLLASTSIAFIATYTIPDRFPLELAFQYCAIVGLELMATSAILIVAGMRFTPIVFLTIGMGMVLEGFVPEVGLCSGLLYLLMAVLTLVRNDRRLILVSVLALTGIVVVMNHVLGFSTPEVDIVIECVLFVLYMYLVAALVNKGRLKLI